MTGSQRGPELRAFFLSLTVIALLAFATGCATALPPAALELTPLTPEDRALHTRLFATEDETAVLNACIAVLREHGFAPEDEEHALGVIVAIKDAEAAGHRTRLRASLATSAGGEFGLDTQLRITFQRLAWNPRGREIAREAVREPGEYAGFFQEVARALALPPPSAE